eukprot:759517-Hanusia_phi.AAC.5
MRDVLRCNNVKWGSQSLVVEERRLEVPVLQDPLTRDCQQILHELRIADPQFLVNGMQGVWIAKVSSPSLETLRTLVLSISSLFRF